MAKARPRRRRAATSTRANSSTPPATSASPPKAAALYALALGWPDDDKLVVRSLASAAGKIAGVTLLGHSGKLDWQQTDDGLVVNLPAQKPCDLAYAFKISAGDLNPVPAIYDTAITHAADGRIVLPAAEAEIHGDYAEVRTWRRQGPDRLLGQGRGFRFVEYQGDKARHVCRRDHLLLRRAPGSAFTVELSGQTLTGQSASTGSWESYRTDKLGTLKLDKPGTFTLTVKPKPEPKWRVIGLKSVTLKPTE